MTTRERNMIERLGGREGIQRLANELAGLLRGDEVLAPLVTGEAWERLRSHVELTLLGSPVDTDIFDAITGVLNRVGATGRIAVARRHGEMVIAFDALLKGDVRPLGRLVRTLNDTDMVQFMAAGNVIASSGELVMTMRARIRGIE